MIVPVVSVVIAVYNGEAFIEETLDSILDQTYKNWECIIVDDGSTDSTKQIVNKYSCHHAKFRLIETKGKNGPYKAANIGIREANGKYIARIDADDIAFPERLERQIERLESNPQFKVCATEHYNLFENGDLVRKTLVNDIEQLKYYLIFKNPLLHSSLFFEKLWFIQIGLYPEKRLAQDYFIWCRAVLENSLTIIHQPLVKWRFNQKSITNTLGTLQSEYALEVNNWYLSNMNKSFLQSEFSLIFFETFRNGGNRSIEFPVLKKSLEYLFELENKIEFSSKITRLKSEFLYSIILANSKSWNEISKLTFFVLTNNIFFIFYMLPYKLLLKSLVRRF